MEWSLTGLPLPIVLRPPSPLTDDELIAFSRKNKPYRIEKNTKGELVIMTPVGMEGGDREQEVSYQLRAWKRQTRRGRANGPNAGWNLPDGSTLSPDACWTSNEHLDAFTKEQRERFVPLCPEFIIEVRSKSDSPFLLFAKMQTWMENGAQLAWMIDPYARTVTVFRTGREPEMLHSPNSVQGEGPVEGFTLTLQEIWA